MKKTILALSYVAAVSAYADTTATKTSEQKPAWNFSGSYELESRVNAAPNNDMNVTNAKLYNSLTLNAASGKFSTYLILDYARKNSNSDFEMQAPWTWTTYKVLDTDKFDVSAYAYLALPYDGAAAYLDTGAYHNLSTSIETSAGKVTPYYAGYTGVSNYADGQELTIKDAKKFGLKGDGKQQTEFSDMGFGAQHWVGVGFTPAAVSDLSVAARTYAHFTNTPKEYTVIEATNETELQYESKTSYYNRYYLDYTINEKLTLNNEVRDSYQSDNRYDIRTGVTYTFM